MSQKVIKNTFQGGLIKDLSKNNVEPTKYIEAVNVTLSKDKQYTALTNLRGNDKLINLLSSVTSGAFDSHQVLGLFFIDWYNLNTNRNTPCLTAFVGLPGSSEYKVYVYDIEDTTLYTVSSISWPVEAQQADLSIDGVIFGENGRNILYFTDFYGEPKKIVCEFPSSTTEREANLLKRGALTAPTVSSVDKTGGSLSCGAYQFAYRLVNRDKNKYSNFSLLTNPVMVFQEPDDVDTVLATGDIGVVTSSQINLSFSFSDDELSDYDYYQIAVFENLDSVNYPPLTARLLTPQLIGSNPNTYTYKSNSGGEIIPADDVVVDKAAIRTWKTMSVKDNVLIAGNIKYKDLSYDNGDPIVGSTSDFITHSYSGSDPQNTRSLYTQQSDASTKVGYFRDELYRFYISYFDEDGNFSRPKALDFSEMSTNNTISGTDVRFPSRGDSTYSIINSSGDLEAIGLNVQDIDNHPSWAYGFVILRAERKKNIIFQSPLIPSILVQPAAAADNYPTSPRNSDDTGVDSLDAQPPTNQSGTYVPKNFLHVVNKSIVKDDSTGGEQVKWEAEGATASTYFSTTITLTASPDGTFATITDTTSGTFQDDFEPFQLVTVSGFSNTSNNGEFYIDNIASQTEMTIVEPNGNSVFVTEGPTTATIEYAPGSEVKGSGANYVHAVFGPEVQFTDFNGQPLQDYSSGVNDQLETVDVAFLRTINKDYTDGTKNPGEFGDTEYSASFFAVDQDDYYYKRGSVLSLPDVDGRTVPISSFDIVPNDTETTVLSSIVGDMVSSDYGNYVGLEAEGLNEGAKPDNLRMGVLVTRTPKDDVTTRCFDATSGYRTGQEVTTQVAHFSGISGNYSGQSNNHFFNGQTPDADTYVGAVEIVNLTKGLGDDRYGEEDEGYNVYSTGAVYTFTPSERLAVSQKNSTPIDIDVWGGDCYIGLSTFKISNSCYSVVPSTETVADAQANWGKSFRDAGGTNEIQRPYPLKAVHQSVSVFLESEVNVEVLPRITYTENTLRSGYRIPRPNLTGSGALRVAQDYSYFPAYSAQNINKIFIPYNDFDKNITDYRARLAYSDVKIYQSDQEGFDNFRAGNVYDMDESYGPITKLVLAANDVFALQEDGVAYVPVNASIIETDDLSQLAVRNNDLIGRIKYINTFNGCRDIRTVTRTPSGFIFYDSANKQLMHVMSREGVQELQEFGVIDLFNNELPDTDSLDRDLFANYDINEKKYYLTYNDTSAGTSKTFVFNSRLNLWEGIEDYEDGKLLGAAYGDKHTYHIGVDDLSTTKSLALYQNDAGTMNEFFGKKITPYATILINPDPELSKVYDNLRIYANGPLEEADMLVERLDASERQRAFGMKLDINPREEFYRLKVVRDEVGRRLRGPKAELTFKWDKDRDEEISVFSVMTKYRDSARIL